MAWFILKDQKKRSLRKGICLRVGAIPKPLMALICKHLPSCSLYRGAMSRGQIDWIEISEMLDKGKVRLHVWTATYRDRMAWGKQCKESYQEDGRPIGQVIDGSGTAAIKPIVSRRTVLEVVLPEDPEWICESDIGRGLVQSKGK